MKFYDARMGRNHEFRSLMLCAVLLLAGCGRAEPFDRLYQSQFSGDDQANEGAFALGYFPNSYDEPQVECGSSAGPFELIGKVEQKWYPSQWQAAREPSLYLLAEQKEPPEFALRFSYIPSFSPSVFIRVHKESESYRLVAKEMNGAGGYDPGTISRSKEIRLSSQQVSDLNRLLAKEALFKEPADNCESGFDGSQWIFEIVDPQGYRMVKRWSPSEGAGYNLGMHLVGLSGWEFDTY